MNGLRVMPIDLAKANAVVAAIHRHHAPAVGHRFSLAVVDGSGLVRGVCIVGRPTARMAGKTKHVCEVSRLATDGTKNACSMLYGAAARTAKAMGFARIQTYTLPQEGGASLRASGWVLEGEAGGGDWNRVSRVRRTDQPMSVKHKWSLTLHTDLRELRLPAVAERFGDNADLFGACS